MLMETIIFYLKKSSKYMQNFYTHFMRLTYIFD